MDFVDASIVNVALPSIRHDLDFSVQNLQWVLSGYLLTYGGFLLLGGRCADLLGRRGCSSPESRSSPSPRSSGGLAPTAGAADRCPTRAGVRGRDDAPAALSILTTTFREGNGPAQGARCVGRRRRYRLGCGRTARGGPGPGARLEMGALRQPSGLVILALATFRVVTGRGEPHRLSTLTHSGQRPSPVACSS